MIGWVCQLPSVNAIKPGAVEKLVKNQSDFIRACFHKSNDYSIGSLMLDYIEENSGEDPNNRGVKSGLYKAVTKGVTDTTGIVTRMTKEINNYFAVKPSFECDGHLDKYLTDADIKEFLETYIGANNWDQVPKNARKACYKDNSSKNSLPKWNAISREAFYSY